MTPIPDDGRLDPHPDRGLMVDATSSVQVPMLAYITLIFVCQLAGELIVAALGLPVPGPVAGMLILLAGLLIRGEVPGELAAVGDALLANLSLLFVPAGVGVMLHTGLLGREWLAVGVALVASTALTIVATALVMHWLTPRGERGDEKP